MTAQQVENPSPPWVELYAPAPTEYERRLLTATNASNKPEDVWTNALSLHRLIIIEEVRKRLAVEQVINEHTIRAVLDTVWQIKFPMFQRATGPMIAEAYLRAFRDAKAGNVPIKMIYALAEEHAKRTGDYFNGTSSDALVQGFNTYVNRQVPEKAAIARVLDAYGLTPRQMSGLTSNKQFDTKVESSFPANIKKKVKRYIGRSIEQRLGLFSRQEAHNLDQQAQQVAWMWMKQHGKIPETAEKMWITAKDEKVCAICGPLHRTKIPVTERFILEDGQKLYVPGAHPNCRCTVRLQIPVLELVGKADDFDPTEHPRGTQGRFVRRAPQHNPPVTERYRDPRLEELFREVQAEQEREAAIDQMMVEDAQTALPPIQGVEPIKGLGSFAPAVRGIPEIKGAVPEQAPVKGPEVRGVQLQGVPILGINADEIRLPDREQILGQLLEEIKGAPVLPPFPFAPVTPRAPAPGPSGPPPPTGQVGQPFFDRNGAAQTVYMLVPSADTGYIDWYQDNLFHLSGNDELKAFNPVVNAQQIRDEIDTQFQINVETVSDAILDRALTDGYGTIVEDRYGKEHRMMRVKYVGTNQAHKNDGWYCHLDEKALHRLIEWYGRGGEKTAGDESIPVTWIDDRGDTHDEPAFKSDFIAAPELDIDKEALKVIVVQLNAGHLDDVHLDTDEQGEDTWTAPGDYLVGPRLRSHADISLPTTPVEYWTLKMPDDEDWEADDDLLSELDRADHPDYGYGDRFRPDSPPD